MDFTRFTSCSDQPVNGARQAIIDNTIIYAKTKGYVGDGSLADLESLFIEYNYTEVSAQVLYDVAIDKVGFFADCMYWFRYLT